MQRLINQRGHRRSIIMFLIREESDGGHRIKRLLCIGFKQLCQVDPIMMTSSNGNIFRVAGPLCGEFTGPGEFPAQRPMPRSFDVFFHLRLNKRLSKQPRGWWFETPQWSLWRHCNGWPLEPCYQSCIHKRFRDLTRSYSSYGYCS